MTFQSLQGIWFDRDTRLRMLEESVGDSFNPYKGFGSIATSKPRTRRTSIRQVSIPTRDLVRSRPRSARALSVLQMFQSLQGIWFDRDLTRLSHETGLTIGFNPYKGFGSIATIAQLSQAVADQVSIPTRDLVRSRPLPWTASRATALFQSLQGIWFDRDGAPLQPIYYAVFKVQMRGIG